MIWIAYGALIILVFVLDWIRAKQISSLKKELTTKDIEDQWIRKIYG